MKIFTIAGPVVPYFLLAYMALCRIKTVEQLRYQPPGELGKLLGLDRIPEVRCLRNKLKILVQDDAPEKRAALLSRDWMDMCVFIMAL